MNRYKGLTTIFLGSLVLSLLLKGGNVTQPHTNINSPQRQVTITLVPSTNRQAFLESFSIPVQLEPQLSSLLFEYKYPYATTLYSQDTALRLSSFDNPQAIVSWYESLLRQKFYSVTVETHVTKHGTVSKTLNAFGDAGLVTVVITKHLSLSAVEISVSCTTTESKSI